MVKFVLSGSADVQEDLLLQMNNNVCLLVVWLFLFFCCKKNNNTGTGKKAKGEKKASKIVYLIIYCKCVCLPVSSFTPHQNTGLFTCCLLCAPFLCGVTQRNGLWWCQTEQVNKYYFMYCDGFLFMLLSTEYYLLKHI